MRQSLHVAAEVLVVHSCANQEAQPKNVIYPKAVKPSQFNQFCCSTRMLTPKNLKRKFLKTRFSGSQSTKTNPPLLLTQNELKFFTKIYHHHNAPLSLSSRQLLLTITSIVIAFEQTTKEWRWEKNIMK